MPMHDWTRVEAGISHDFHHEWISAIKHTLNAALPSSYYALAEQQAAGFGPDVLTLHDAHTVPVDSTAVALAQPQAKLVGMSDAKFYLRKKSRVVIRHVTGDRVIAIVEIVSPGNRSTSGAVRSFVEKVWELLEQKIHVLIIDPFPPDKRVPHGLHARIFADIEDQPYQPPPEKPLTLIAYECRERVRAFVESFAAGDCLAPMPVFLSPSTLFVEVPLEETYLTACKTLPPRWQRVVAGTVSR
ncbi:MAG: DUF4058 family protein [Planctomycetaceae bacterium]|nr:DUF4058 family protein [Planctomycetaceae bacterium]